MLTAVSNLFAVGGASLAARTLGRREDEKAKDICALSFWGALLASVLFSLLFWSLASPILYLCGATADTYPVRVRIREVGRALRRRGDRAERPAGKPYSRRGKRAGRRFGRFSGRNLQHCIGPDFRPAPLPESGRGRRRRGDGDFQYSRRAVLHPVCRGKTAVNYRQPFAGAAKARTQAHQRYPRRRFSVRRAICADRRFDRRHFKIRFGICHGGRRRAGHRQKAGPAPAVLLHRRGKRAAAVFGL